MRVAFFTTLTNSPWGGSEVLWSNVAMQMAKNGHTVAAYVKQWPREPAQVSRLRVAGIQVSFYRDERSAGLMGKIRNRIPAMKRNASMLSELFQSGPEFIFISQGHCYDIGYYSNEQLQPLFASGIPFAIICQNNTDYSFIPDVEVRERLKRIYAKADKIWFVSRRNHESAEMLICDKITNAAFISNSTSLGPGVSTILSPVANEEIQFACVARLRCSHKGQNLLLHVLNQRKWRERKWKLNLFGSGEDEDYLKELTGFFGLKDRVSFHGQANDIENIWKHNHLLLLASFGEGMPLALQEAMLCGRPAVVTDVGGNSELIEDGVTGWLANGTTFSAFDDALERAWQQRGNWDKVGKEAFAKVGRFIDPAPERTLCEYACSIVKSSVN